MLKPFLTCFLFAVLAQPCCAQWCLPTKAGAQPDSPYSYIRTEIIALQWIRNGLTESEKWVSFNDPQQIQKSAELSALVNNVSDDYDCATSLLTPYKDSKNESVRTSAESLLLAIRNTKEVNSVLIGLMESLNKATKPEDINQVQIGKTLADIKSMQKYVRDLVTVGVKMSTFGVLQMERYGDDAKPTAFTITTAQLDTLLAETRELSKKNGRETYVDVCAEILLTMLTQQLPTVS
jgi:hypothetical protein